MYEEADFIWKPTNFSAKVQFFAAKWIFNIDSKVHKFILLMQGFGKLDLSVRRGNKLVFNHIQKINGI